MRAPLDHSPAAIRRARMFRKNMTLSEKRMLRVLRRKNLGYKFRSQHPIKPYCLDFYCPELALCIEVDGDMHDPIKDKKRDDCLAKRGIKTIRIPSLALFVKDADIITYLLSEFEVRKKELETLHSRK